MTEIVAGAAAGVGAQQLWDLIKRPFAFHRDFKKQYKRVGKDLENLRSAVDGRPTDSEDEALCSKLERGSTLINECALLPWWNVVNKVIYSERLKDLKEEIRRLWDSAMMSGMHQITSKLDELRRESEVGRDLPPLPDKVYGIEKPLIELKVMLEGHRVVGVFGIGGCGKTTLANVLCRDPDIQAKYGKPIFLKISSSHDLGTFLKEFDNNVGTFPNDAQTSGRTEKVLIVLDDVPSINNDIRPLVYAINKAVHFKFLITSRIQLSVCESSYSVNLLSEDDARKLFEHHAFPGCGSHSKPDNQLIDAIVRGCKFYPLALEVIGSSLAERDAKMWQNAADKLAMTGGIFGDRDGEIFKCLSTSFESLKEEERECFLDLGSFPEGRTIPASVIIDMWSETRNWTENEAYGILLELGRRNLVKLVDRKCGDAGDLDGSFSSLSVTQHDILRELAIRNCKMEGESHFTRMILENRADNIPTSWMPERDQTTKAKLVSINTGDMKSSDWPNMYFPNAEVLILSFSATSYCLPQLLQNMKNLKVLVVMNHGSNRTKISGLSLLSCLKKLKRVVFRNISFPAEPLQMVERGLGSQLQKVVKSVISLAIGASVEPPQELHKLSLILCDVHHMLHIISLFPIVRDLEVDYCTDLDKLPDAICDISSIEKLSITNFPDLLELPDGIGKLCELKVLRLHACGKLKQLPHSLSELSSLGFLDISYCHDLVAFPPEMDKLTSLKKIDMRSCLSITELPLFMVQLIQRLEVVCDETGASLLNSYRLVPSKLDVRREEVNLRFLHG